MTEATIDCRIASTALDVTALRKSLPDMPGCGGYVVFEGLIRNVNHGKSVTRLEYEVYETLALKELKRICEYACERFQLKYVRAWHREGRLEIGDTAVMIQVLSRHRREAFEGCRFIIDQLKARVPIWKKEFYDDGSATWTQCHEHHAHDAPGHF